MFWQKRKPDEHVVVSGGFTIGQIVKHKLDGERFVVISFYSHDVDGPQAYCSVTSKLDSYLLFYLAEIEPLSQSTGASHAG